MLRPLIALIVALWLPPLHAANVLVLGDSLSAAYGMNENQGWVQLLRERLEQKQLDIQVINASISGETTAGGLARLPRLLNEYEPSVVILELGGNDGLRGYPIQSMKKQLQRSVQLSHQHQAQVLLLGMEIPPNYGRRYSELFRSAYQEIAKHNELVLVPFFLEGVATNRELMQADGIHPRSEAQAQMLDNVWPLLEPLLDADSKQLETSANH
jgi:acyl-CoA thioesterase-1